VVGGTFTVLWIYFIGPVVGALLAVFAYRHRRTGVACGKLFHTDAVECRFFDCQYTPPQRRITASRPAETPSRFVARRRLNALPSINSS
jgi:hypothetical protein